MNGVEIEIDQNGRVVIPMEFRKKLGIVKNSKVLIFSSSGEIIIRPKNELCALCGARIVSSCEIRLCGSCLSMVKEKY